MPEVLVSTANQGRELLEIKGLDCPDCAARIEKAVKKVPGVVAAHLTFPAGRLDLELNPEQVELAQVINRIEALGYQAVPQTPAGFLENRPPLGQMSGLASLWRGNPYLLPTIISGLVLLMAAGGRLLGLSPRAFTWLIICGIAVSVYMPARSGIALLLAVREMDMNFLMTVAVAGAAAIGELQEAAVVVFLFSLGNALQGYTLEKTRRSIRSLMELAPDQALVRREGRDMVLPVRQIRVGDTIIIRPGERIAMDGRVVSGFSSVNQASITGESLPVEKGPGDQVFAGTINEKGALEVEVAHTAQDNVIARIMEMVEKAQEQRAPSQQVVDRFARYYTPAVLATALGVAVIPPLVLHQPWLKWVYEALAMLLVACPCALVISTPVTIISAIGSAARNGVLIKGGAFLEKAGELAAVALDKTGTVTTGKPDVVEVAPCNSLSRKELLAIAASIESRSEHPLAGAVVSRACQEGLELAPVDDFVSVPGKGACGRIEGRIFRVGSLRYMEEMGLDTEYVRPRVEEMQEQGQSVILVGGESQVLGAIGVADRLRSNSPEAIRRLKKAGIARVVMLSGDNRKTAESIACQIGVDEVVADLLPEDKAAAVRELGQKYGPVAMVGDGVNDAPALASAAVGIAMGAAGTDAALETADIALMADDLTKLGYTIRLGRAAVRVIKQNITLALLIKASVLLMVIPGWLTLWLAVVGDVGASLLVTLNGMRMMRFKEEH